MHLLRRNGTYYFRYVLPTTLATQLQASEIRFTLNTYNKTYATTLAAQCFVRCCALATQAFSNLDQATNYVKNVPTLMDKLTPLITLLMRSDTVSLQQAFRVLNSNNYPVFVKLPGLNEYAYQASKLNNQGVWLQIRLDNHPDKIIVPYFDGQIELKSGLIDDRTMITFTAPYTVHLHQLHVDKLPEEMVAQLRAITPTQAAAPKLPESPLISVEFTKFKELKAPSWSSVKTVDEYDAMMALFMEIIGDKPVLTLSNDDYDKFILTVRKLPPNRKQPKLRMLTVEQIIAMELDPISERTLEKYHTRAVTFIDWLKKRHRELHIHPTLPKAKQKVSAKKKRKRFEASHLSTIFESDASLEIKRRFNYQAWLPVLGLFTGARINELCQLKLTDIHDEAPIPYVSINDEGVTGQVKTASAVRDIPIHPMLIELGFLDFVKQQRSLNVRKTDGRLFGELKFTEGRGYGNKASDWFGKFLDKLKITDKSYVFHSFRHTVSRKLNDTDLKDWRISRYLGHDVDDDASESVQSYMNDAKVSDLLPVLDAITYSIDWTGYRKLLQVR